MGSASSKRGREDEKKAEEEAAKRVKVEEAEEAEQLKAEAEAKKKVEEEAEAKKKVEEEAEAKKKVEEEAEAKKEEEEEAAAVEAVNKKIEEDKKAKEEAEEAEQLKAEAEAKKKAEEEAHRALLVRGPLALAQLQKATEAATKAAELATKAAETSQRLIDRRGRATGGGGYNDRGRDRYQDDRRSYDDRRDNRGYGFGGGRDNNDQRDDRGGYERSPSVWNIGNDAVLGKFHLNSLHERSVNKHTVRNLHFLSKNSTLTFQENWGFFWVKNS